MKFKAIITLIMIVAMVFSAAVAAATSLPLGDGMSGWFTTSGSFAYDSAAGGVKSTSSNDVSRTFYSITTDPSGAFSFTSNFKVNNASSDVHAGVATGTNNDIAVGWSAASNQFVVVKDNDQMLATLGGTLDPGATYTAKITSSDGSNFQCSVLKGGSQVGTTATVTGYKPTMAALTIENNGAPTGPVISSVDYTSPVSVSPTPTPSPSPSPTVSPSPSPTTSPTKVSLDLKGIRDFYAKQPVVHMSNQSVIYNPDGTIKQVITGPTNTTGAVVISATPQPTVKPNATTNATATPLPTNATATPVTPSPTKAQSPGFEIVLAAMGMIAALALITRKKK